MATNKPDQSFFFYDLETSGFSARADRIMQFAGQRTDMDLQPIGQPVNVLIKLTPDVLPSPEAILLTGITPQKTLAEGVSEAEFVRLFIKEIATPGTIFVGYNSIRFDDEFMRFLLWRNFVDPYEWQWQDGRGRWDLLDVARIARALRPQGINWPSTEDGKPTVKLELMTRANKISHDDAHDALADVNATIAVANLIKQKQPDLFNFMLSMRDKKKVAELVMAGQPFVYTSGKYPSEFDKTTVAAAVAKHPKKQAALVWDLRQDPTEFLGLSPSQLAERWQWTKDEDAPSRLPIKTLQFNRCPAVAPLGVLKQAGAMERLKLDMDQIKVNLKKLSSAAAEFTPKLLEALELMDQAQFKRQKSASLLPDAQLYDGFLPDADRGLLAAICDCSPDNLSQFKDKLTDKRLQQLLPLYQARNFANTLTPEQTAWWHDFCSQQLQTGGGTSRLALYGQKLQELAAIRTSKQDQFLLEELTLYGQSTIQ